MPGLGDTLFDLSQMRLQGMGKTRAASALSRMEPTGSNPGQLDMHAFVPPGLPRGAPLVVALHGCGQTASGFDAGAGWSTLAARHGFALLLPEQRRANNANTCFNWFHPEDVTRDTGEVLSIRQMITQMIEANGLNPARVYVTGLSAGGAMTAALLATYPKVFAGGAVIAGLPYGAARDLSSAMEAMRHTQNRTAADWGDLVRRASPLSPRRPAVQIWHGTADTVVRPVAADELIKQWTDVLGVTGAPETETVDGASHTVWRGTDGLAAVESYLVPGLAHGLPLRVDASVDDEAVGVPAPFMIDAGISSTWRIARAWGLLTQPARQRSDQRAAASRDPVSAVASTVEKTIRNALRAAGLRN